MSFEIKRHDLRLVECESLWSMLHRWLATLWRLAKRIQTRRK